MQDEFTLPVSFEGKNMELPARLSRYGYTVRIEVDIGETTIVFEPDEERNWRAVMNYEDVMEGKLIKKDLLEAVVEVIERFTK